MRTFGANLLKFLFFFFFLTCQTNSDVKLSCDLLSCDYHMIMADLLIESLSFASLNKIGENEK